MIRNFTEQIKGTRLLQGYSHFTPYQVLTVASLIQIEADEVDYAKAARVIDNRLAINMPLQLNSTVQYALNLRGRIALFSSSKSGSFSVQHLPSHRVNADSNIESRATGNKKQRLNPLRGIGYIS
jgi:hypothetical protein